MFYNEEEDEEFVQEFVHESMKHPDMQNTWNVFDSEWKKLKELNKDLAAEIGQNMIDACLPSAADEVEDFRAEPVYEVCVKKAQEAVRQFLDVQVLKTKDRLMRLINGEDAGGES